MNIEQLNAYKELKAYLKENIKEGLGTDFKTITGDIIMDISEGRTTSDTHSLSRLYNITVILVKMEAEATLLVPVEN